MSLGCTHRPDIGVSPARGPHRATPALDLRLERVAGRALVALALCALGACADGAESGRSEFAGDGSLGGPGGPLYPDAAVEDQDSETSGDAGSSGGDGVRLRVLQGVLNLPNAFVCHDPDFVLDDPSTDEDETDPGPKPPVQLPFHDGGSVAYGQATPYVELPAMSAGAITVHRGPELDAGVSDAAAPPGQDSGAALDASAGDGGTDQPEDAAPGVDAPSATLSDPCDPAQLESVLPLPATSAWYAPERAADAGIGLDLLGFVGTAGDGDTLTLFGSGFALNPAELARRREAARAAYLAANPEAPEKAEAEARRQVRSLESTYGARFLLARGARPSPNLVALSLAHLVPDVPSNSSARPQDAGVDSGSGPLHLCVTVDQKESEVSDAGVPRLEFRSVQVLGTQFEPGASYRFRLFAAADYQQGASTCVTNSLKPIARLDVDAGTFEADRSYTLVASGAVAPASTCTTVNSTSLIRQTCALSVDKLNAQIHIVPNDLPPEK